MSKIVLSNSFIRTTCKSALNEDKKAIAIIGKEVAERKLKHLKLSLRR